MINEFKINLGREYLFIKDDSFSPRCAVYQLEVRDSQENDDLLVSCSVPYRVLKSLRDGLNLILLKNELMEDK